MKQKIKKVQWKRILIVLIFIILFFGYVYFECMEIRDDIEECKERGFDGIKFENKYSIQRRCSNFKGDELK